MRGRGWADTRVLMPRPAMKAAPHADPRLATALALLCIALFAFQLWLHATSTSATTDEPVHLMAGHRHLHCADFAFNPEHPPLLKELAALPLQGMDIRMPDGLRCDVGLTPKAESFRLGAQFLADNGGDRVLVPARLMAALLAVLLALLVWLASRRMFGAWTAAATTGLLAMEPVMVAHGSLVTTDMAITATTFLSVLAMYEGRHWRTLPRVLAVGLGFGLMLASKHSALLLLPLLGLLYMADAAALGREGRWSAREYLLKPLSELAAAGVIALLVLWAFYGFRYSAAPGHADAIDVGVLLQSTGKPGAQDSLLASALAWLQRSALFPEAYLVGLADIVGHSVRYTTVLGQLYSEGQWFFYPIAFSIKSSITLLMLLPIGIALMIRDPAKRRALVFLLLPSLGYLAIGMSSKFTDGIRHILQVYPYFLMLAGFGLASLWRRGWAFAGVLACLLAVQTVTVARTAPDYIPFANAFWGGPSRAYWALTFDSVEWGQSLKRIRDYVSQHGIDQCWVAGVEDPALYADVSPCRRLPEGRSWRARRTDGGVVPPIIEGTLFLGVRMASAREGETYRSLIGHQDALLAGAVMVYEGRFALPRAAALSHATHADALVLAGQAAQAVEEGQQAVRLASDDPRSWISLGEALLAAGHLDEARHAQARAAQALAADPAGYSVFARPRLEALHRVLEARSAGVQSPAQ